MWRQSTQESQWAVCVWASSFCFLSPHVFSFRNRVVRPRNEMLMNSFLWPEKINSEEKHPENVLRRDTKQTHGRNNRAIKYHRLRKLSYQSDLAYFRNACLDRSWCVWGSAEMPCALRVLGPISWALGRTDWHLCNFLFSSWISSSRSASRLSKSRILSSFSSRILAKSSSKSLMAKICVKLCRYSPRGGQND